jgi:ParB family transcriptional regulator, chromosome partitioning protein
MAPEKSQRRLGRGLDALFNAPTTQGATTQTEGALREIAISEIVPNPFQPRKNFQAAELRELQESLQTNGLLQPVTVRQASKGKGYELIAGERRLRAATNLGWKEIPAVIKDLTDQQVLTLALVENLQRSDLNPIEEAEGYEQLIRDFGYTQQTVADLVGKDRSTVANVLRILHLPHPVRALIQEGHLTAGQARPLLGLDDSARITTFANQAVVNGWSAREIERRVRESPKTAAPRKGRPRKTDERPPEIRLLEQQLRKHLQTDVAITLKAVDRGTIAISFYSPDDLARVMELMGIIDNPQ